MRRITFVLGMLLGIVVAIPIFIRSLLRGMRAFHEHGTVCRAEVTALDEAGRALAGSARVRFSPASGDADAPGQTIIGCAIKFGENQDVALATFEKLLGIPDGTKHTNVTDYFANQYPSATPWRVRGLGDVWFRLIPNAPIATDGVRSARLDAQIAAGAATLTLETRSAPYPDGPLRVKLVEIKLVAREPQDDPKFHISMFRSGKGVSATGLRNGVRSIVYPFSQLGRTIRGG